MASSKKDRSTGSVEHKKLYDTWVEFSKDISDRFMEVAKGGNGEYKELYDIWSEYTQHMGNYLSKFSPSDENAVHDLQHLWEDFSGKASEMGKNFAEMFKNGEGPFKDMHPTFNSYSEKMSMSLSELMNKSIKEQKELYEVWMDAFENQDTTPIKGTPEAFEGMGKFWMEMWNSSKDMFPLKEGEDINAKFKEMNDLWTKTYSKNIIDVLKSDGFATMNKNILNSNLDMKMLNEKMANQFLLSLGMPTKENIDDIYRKLYEIDKKLSKIARNRWKD